MREVETMNSTWDPLFHTVATPLTADVCIYMSHRKDLPLDFSSHLC